MITRRRLVAAVALALVTTLGTGQAALAASPGPASPGPASPGSAEPTVPLQVADYFAAGLVPRLAELYGPGKKAGSPLAFGEATKVGEIHRVLGWTPAYLAGTATADPTELTNDWVATVSAKDDTVIGEALVWINPGSDRPELADFDLGTSLASALARAPGGALILHDDARKAWLAIDGARLTVLVAGTSGAAGTTTAAAYQRRLAGEPATAGATVNVGLVIAAAVLAVVIVLLALFVLLPGRRRARADAAGSIPAPVEPPIELDVTGDPTPPSVAEDQVEAEAAGDPD